MTSISDLPLELLHKIIPLTVEDSIAINDEKSRRNILLNLALVSKEFTIPAQRLLWDNMTFADVVAVQDLIGKGFGKERSVKKLAIFITSARSGELEVQIKLDIVKNFLEGIKEVFTFGLVWLSRSIHTGPQISNFFSIQSTRKIKSLLNSNCLEFTSENSTSPPALTSFDCFDPEDYTDQVVEILKSSINSLRSLSLFTWSHTDFISTLLPSFRVVAPNLTYLSITASRDAIVEALLPFSTSLKSLTLVYTPYNLPTIKNHLANLDLSVMLESLELSWSNSSENFTSIIQILYFKQLKDLKYLYLSSAKDGAPRPELIKQLNNEFVVECEKRGIKLLFGGAEQVRLEEEKERQAAFKQKQVTLDSNMKQ